MILTVTLTLSESSWEYALNFVYFFMLLCNHLIILLKIRLLLTTSKNKIEIRPKNYDKCAKYNNEIKIDFTL